jgi:hypothetical protein
MAAEADADTVFKLSSVGPLTAGLASSPPGEARSDDAEPAGWLVFSGLPLPGEPLGRVGTAGPRRIEAPQARLLDGLDCGNLPFISVDENDRERL